MKHESVAAVEPTPLLGFNNNVRHKGRLFHIQTEDSGVRHARIMTHLFADGGRIIKSARTDYSHLLGSREIVRTVRDLMKEQHRSMFIALRDGSFDEAVVAVCGHYPEPESETVPSSKRYAAEIAPTLESATVESAAQPSAATSATDEVPPAQSSAAPKRGASSPAVAAITASIPRPTRPAATFSGMPKASSRSIFGDDMMREQSLDDVILSYIADELAEEA